MWEQYNVLQSRMGLTPWQIGCWTMGHYTIHIWHSRGIQYNIRWTVPAPNGEVVATSQEVWEEVIIPQVIDDYVEKQRSALSNIVEYSAVLGFDYYHFTKDFWFHSWGNLMPYHVDTGNEYSYYNTKVNNG